MTKTEKIILSLIILVALLLRFYHLTFQSLWLDELHTMIEANPKLSLKELFYYLTCCDQHPPLFFFLEKLFFTLFGHTEWVARSVTAICGTASVWAICLLGKELYNTATGLTVAAFTCVNYFAIYYSQDARGYILAFLFACFSFLFLVRMIKRLQWKETLLFSLFTLLMMYSHYYGLFVAVAQGVILGAWWLIEKENKAVLFKHLLLGFILIGIVYSLWLPFILDMTLIKSFWITGVSTNFATDYFFEYFGNSDLLKPFLLLFLIGYFVQVFMAKGSLKEQPLAFGFFVCAGWLFITYLIPYLRSVFVVPMLFPRYTIVVLPAILLMLASGVQSLNNLIIKNMLIGMFLLVSVLDLVGIKKYYSTVNKTQFRELTTYITEHNASQLPIINPRTAWHFQYYANHYKIGNQLLDENTDYLIDSFIHAKNTKGFWLVGAHNNPPKLNDEQLKLLSANYIQTENVNYFDAWLQQYVSVHALGGKYTAVHFHPSLTFNLDKQNIIALWGGKITTETINLSKGKYILKLFSKGTPVQGEFPRIKININQQHLTDYISKQEIEQADFIFETDGNPVQLSFEMLNDKNVNGEDRNFFIQQAFILKGE